MRVSRPINGGLLMTWGNGGRPPYPSRQGSGFILFTTGTPSQSTVIDSVTRETDFWMTGTARPKTAIEVDPAPTRDGKDQFPHYRRLRLWQFTVRCMEYNEHAQRSGRLMLPLPQTRFLTPWTAITTWAHPAKPGQPMEAHHA